MLVSMQVSRKLDFEDPTVLFYVRVAYVTGTVATLLIYYYTQYLINSKNDLSTLKYVEPPNTMAGETESKLVVTTVKDYDLKQLNSAIKGVFTSVAMTGFMHLYMKFANPLVLQSISPVKSALENNIVQIYLFKKPASGDLKRPFKTSGGLFGGFGSQGPKTDKASIEKAETSGAGGVKEE
ncbi:DEKNAAC100295 [Brettanomyces naardenensis]|uniref:DEKNAAC100295 n=1 Tax=Brettanomyces naardenensis TaxID=13370 RepID=A0A448YGA6_BRENA|nr:DEKNAAC100295 [Brettanomyces naardenensis]